MSVEAFAIVVLVLGCGLVAMGFYAWEQRAKRLEAEEEADREGFEVALLREQTPFPMGERLP